MGNSTTSSKRDNSADNVLNKRYSALVEAGRVREDPAQREVLSRLERLRTSLEPAGGLFKKKARAEAKGIYLWGSVGRGKSMLMDLFFEEAPVKKKRRVHFHAFMQYVHKEIHRIRKEGARGKTGADPVIVTARHIGREVSLLCFDELQATDVADATLLYRLFDHLFDAGVTIVSTSNRPPASLYTGGVQRERFDKLVALIDDKMEVVALSSERDYRQLQMQSMQRTYVTPLGPSAAKFVQHAIRRLCANTHAHKETMTVQGRTLEFSLYDNSVGRFTFHDLCENPLGAADYLALATRLDTVILTDIPALSAEQRNEAKRFVTLIDALYEHKVKLLCTADVPPEGIYADGDGAFEFRRTVSRMKEMQSAKWFQNE